MCLITKQKIIIAVILFLCVIAPTATYIAPQPSYAQETVRRIDGPGLRTPGSTAYNGISAEKDLSDFIVGITNFTLSFVTTIAVLMLLYGGYLWIVDAGEGDMVEKAKKIIAGSVIGILIVISAYTIVNTISGFGDENDMCAQAIQNNDLAMQLVYCQNTATGNSSIAGIGGLIGGILGGLF